MNYLEENFKDEIKYVKENILGMKCEDKKEDEFQVKKYLKKARDFRE
jgi:hypothetical protein